MPRPRPHGIASPLWVSALLVLLLNDHLLKGRAPPLLTGKLSDFAGMIVAPVLLAGLLAPLSRRLGRTLAFAAVTFVFVLVQVWPAAAASLDAGLGALGLPWRTWSDPTDLVALSMLPLAWRIARPLEALPARSRLRPTLAVAGLFACAASGWVEPGWQAPAFVANHTRQTLALRVRWLDGALDCGALPAHPEALGREAFGEAVRYDLEPEATFGLGRAVEPGDRPDTRSCDAVLLDVQGMAPVVVAWGSPTGGPFPRSSIPLELPEGDREDLHGIRVRLSTRGGLHATVGEALLLAPVAPSEPGATCPLGPQAPFEHTEVPTTLERVVTARSELGGCTTVELADWPDDLHLCVPAEEIPFGVGDRLVVEPLNPARGRGLALARRGPAPVEVWILSGLDALDIDGVAGRLTPRAGCGERLACGTYREPATLELLDGSRVGPGGALQLAHPSGGALRVRVGRADHTIFAAERCAEGPEALGPRLDVILTRTGR